MGGRLVSWPLGLRANYREPLSGPRTVGAASTQAASGFIQTSGAAFGLWKWRFQFPPIRGQLFRRYRGWVTSLHGGANATRVPFCDWDGLTPAQAGLPLKSWRTDQPWSNGMPWSNGQPWNGSPPNVAVAVPADRDATIVRLGAAFWGHRLNIGDLFGFFPLHLGLYMVTEVIEPGEYRVWPPLRKAVTADDYATLRPVLAMRLESEEGANAPRGAAFSEGLSVTLIETLDYDVRDYFSDATPASPPIPAPWILARGRWDDFGVWADAEVYVGAAIGTFDAIENGVSATQVTGTINALLGRWALLVGGGIPPTFGDARERINAIAATNGLPAIGTTDTGIVARQKINALLPISVTHRLSADFANNSYAAEVAPA